MYSLLLKDLLGHRLAREAPAAAGALIIVDLFYKFHSFTLECLAFLATWYVLGWISAVLLPGPKSFRGWGPRD
jgi:hypothetical protein